VLATGRLSLRPWQEEDLEAAITFCSDPEVMKQVGNGVPWNREETLAFLQQEIQHQQLHGFCRWAVVEPEQGSPIGFCGFVSVSEGIEMGWRLASGYWGRGLASEIAEAVLHHGQETLKLGPITATIQHGNTASRRVAEKIGFIESGILLRNGQQIVVFLAPGSRPARPPPDGS